MNRRYCFEHRLGAAHRVAGFVSRSSVSWAKVGPRTSVHGMRLRIDSTFRWEVTCEGVAADAVAPAICDTLFVNPRGKARAFHDEARRSRSRGRPIAHWPAAVRPSIVSFQKLGTSQVIRDSGSITSSIDIDTVYRKKLFAWAHTQTEAAFEGTTLQTPRWVEDLGRRV